MNINGRCHCGAISFTARVDPARVIACHCADCQTFSGAPFRAVLPTPADQVRLTGTARHYVKVAASGNRRVQAFCPECGTQLYATEADGEPRVLNLRLGCVDERAQLAPKVQIWCASALPWLAALDTVPRHGQGLASPAWPAATPRPDDVLPDEAFFRALEVERTRALVSRDVAAVRRLHAPDYELISVPGRSMSLERYVALIEADVFYARWEHGPMRVTRSAGMAAVRYLARIGFPSGNEVICWHTDLYIRRDGSWVAQWSQATPVPAGTDFAAATA